MKKIRLILMFTLLNFCAFAQKSMTFQQAEKTEISEKDEEIFLTVEEQAKFIGGTRAMYQFLAANIKYPEAAQKANVEGKIFLEFVIQRDGSISNINILKGIGFGCDEEAIRIIKAMPNWKPAKLGGKSVNSRFTLPILFILEKAVKKK